MAAAKVALMSSDCSLDDSRACRAREAYRADFLPELFSSVQRRRSPHPAPGRVDQVPTVSAPIRRSLAQCWLRQPHGVRGAAGGQERCGATAGSRAVLGAIARRRSVAGHGGIGAVARGWWLHSAPWQRTGRCPVARHGWRKCASPRRRPQGQCWGSLARHGGCSLARCRWHPVARRGGSALAWWWRRSAPRCWRHSVARCWRHSVARCWRHSVARCWRHSAARQRRYSVARRWWHPFAWHGCRDPFAWHGCRDPFAWHGCRDPFAWHGVWCAIAWWRPADARRCAAVDALDVGHFW